MPAEEYELKLTGSNDEWFAQLDRRFDGLAKRFGQQLGKSAGGGPGGGGGGSAGGGAGGASSGGGGGLGSLLGGKGGAVGGALGGAVNLAAQAANAAMEGAKRGYAATPDGALNSPGVVAQNMKSGAISGMLGFAASLPGPVGMVGTYLERQFEAAENKFRVPTDRAMHRLEGVVGGLAAAGVNVSDEWIQGAAKRSLQVEGRRHKAELRVQRFVQEAGLEMRSSSYSLGQLGV